MNDLPEKYQLTHFDENGTVIHSRPVDAKIRQGILLNPLANKGNTEWPDEKTVVITYEDGTSTKIEEIL